MSAASKKKSKKVGAKGVVHIRATFNNTLITITDTNG
nr:30S ribosomal protein S11 [Planctomycetota bacterium]